jgi:hypothetical protein
MFHLCSCFEPKRGKSQAAIMTARAFTSAGPLLAFSHRALLLSLEH